MNHKRKPLSAAGNCDECEGHGYDPNNASQICPACVETNDHLGAIRLNAAGRVEVEVCGRVFVLSTEALQEIREDAGAEVSLGAATDAIERARRDGYKRAMGEVYHAYHVAPACFEPERQAMLDAIPMKARTVEAVAAALDLPRVSL